MLDANAWTSDEAGRNRFIWDLATGMAFTDGIVTLYPQLPFGGIKISGHDRKPSVEGIRDF